MALPFEMIDEILYRLPVKPLLRFRCVSKGWCSLIDSNSFAKKQLKNTLDCNAGVSLMLAKQGGDQKFYLAGFDSLVDESADVVEIDDPLKGFLCDAEIVGASNGLMCVLKNKRKDVFLLNPTTRKSRKIPRAPPEFSCFFTILGHSHLCGFGYDEVNDDFKVVMIQMCYRPFRGMASMVYSLKTNAWTRGQDVPSNITIIGDMGLFASGSLHWKAFENETMCKDIILGFDLQLQHFHEVPFPPIKTHGNFSTRYLTVVGEYLCISEYLNFNRDVWLMNYSGAERTWYRALSSKELKIDVYTSTKLIAFFRSGEDLLLQEQCDHYTKLKLYNFDRKTVKDVGFRGYPDYFSSYLFTESLLQLTEDEPLQQKKPSKYKRKKNKLKKKRSGAGRLAA